MFEATKTGICKTLVQGCSPLKDLVEIPCIDRSIILSNKGVCRVQQDNLIKAIETAKDFG